MTTNVYTRIYITIAALIALFIGLMSVIAGSSVLMGIGHKTYLVLPWLVLYNVFIGVISIVVAFCIYFLKKHFKIMIMSIFTTHIIVLMYLMFPQTKVATESINAMLFRVFVWVIIIVLGIIIPNNQFKK